MSYACGVRFVWFAVFGSARYRSCTTAHRGKSVLDLLMDELGRDLHDVWTVPAASGLRFLKPGAVGMAIHTEVFVVSGGLCTGR